MRNGTPRELSELLGATQAIADDAASLLLRGYRTGAAVRKKGPIDLVTEYDLRCEELIRERLDALFPDHAVVAEEADEHREAPYTWYVDPLDGTTNFAHGHPFFCVSMGLYHEGQPLLGVIVAPALQVAWSGLRGHGAKRNCEPCRVSATRILQDALCATGFPYDRATTEENNFREFIGFKKRTRGVRRCGAAAIDLAFVSDGTYDVYWEQKLREWDHAAGLLLVQEAGGRVTDYGGGSPFPPTGRVVATNGLLHEEALALLQRVRSEPNLT